MRKTWCVITLLMLGVLNSSAQQFEAAQLISRQHNLMPVPAKVQFQPGRLKIDASFRAAADGHIDARLEAAIHRFSRRLEGRTGFEFSRTQAADAQTATLLVKCNTAGRGVPSVDEDESY